MIRFFSILLTGILTSFFLFPFKFTFFSAVNTKMMMAGLGVLLCIYDLIKKRDQNVDKGIFLLFLFAGLFSLSCLAAIVFNNTSDTEYVTYIASMALWLSGAFAVCRIIKLVHGKLDVKTLCSYFAAVCAFQCIIAIIIDNSIAVQRIVDMFVIQGAPYFRKIDRLYGIGAALDVAGTRFAACIVMLFYFLTSKSEELTDNEIRYYLACLIIVFVFGNMVARTTTIGFILGLAWCAADFVLKRHYKGLTIKPGRVFGKTIVISLIAIPLCVLIYNTNPQMKELFRFAFEGFFSMVEKGEWQVDSNDKLQTMVVFPDNAKTWVIGDGYITNPGNKDLNFIGDITEGNYYMATDIGYLRFIFYCGLIGLIAFMAFMAYCAILCSKRDREHIWLFALILLLNYTIWLKVATDIFLVFALMICTVYLQDNSEKEEEENPIAIESL